MKTIPRNDYLSKLITGQNIDLIKVITGIRRCGKSYLLNKIFKDYLIENGTPEDHIIQVNLEDISHEDLLNHKKLYEYIISRIKDTEPYFALLDEIQLVSGFEKVLNSLLHINNLDTYVTGSSSRFLSSDIITEFRGRSLQIHVYPLSFKEFYNVQNLDKLDAWSKYCKYGGLPLTLEYKTPLEKINYLDTQRDNVYLNDIIERYNIKNQSGLKSLTEIIASNIGSPTNPHKLERSFKSLAHIDLSYHTIEDYLNKLEDAFIIEKSKRYDIKGKRYIDAPTKYYFTDLGIRNSFLNFRQIEETHIMENIIYLELRRRGFNVDVGAVEIREPNGSRKQTEVDFVANLGDNRYYIQSALSIPNTEKAEQESRPLNHINDHFKKIIISRDSSLSSRTENGIITLGLFDFLLDENSLNY